MNRSVSVIAAACALLLAGCGNLVPRNQPEVALRSDFRLGAADEPAIADVNAANEWSGFFTDPRLGQVVAIALAGNRSLRAGAAAVEQARAQYRVSGAARWPTVDVGLEASRGRSGGATTKTAELSAEISAWEIDLFDRLGSLKGAALARYLAQEQTQDAARLALVAEVADAWLALAAEREQLALARDLRDSQQRSLELSEKRYTLGADSGLDRARARTAYEAARGDAERQAGAADQARLALELLAGQPLPGSLLPKGQLEQGQPRQEAQAEPADLTVLPALPAGLPAEVLLRRPDVRAAEQALQAAAYDVGAERAARFPRLTLTAAAGRASDELGHLFDSGTGFWSLLPRLEVTLFDGGAGAARVDAAEAARRGALAGYEATLQSAFREVADALAERDHLADRLDAQRAQVEAAERSLELAEKSYKLGGMSQLELLDAQRQLASSRQELVTLRQTEQANRVELLRALGGRWAAGT